MCEEYRSAPPVNRREETVLRHLLASRVAARVVVSSVRGKDTVTVFEIAGVNMTITQARPGRERRTWHAFALASGEARMRNNGFHTTAHKTALESSL